MLTTHYTHNCNVSQQYQGNYSILAPDTSTNALYFSSSLSSIALKAALEISSASDPIVRKASTTSSDCKALLNAAFNCATIASGVPPVVKTPNQVPKSKSSTPASSIVGISGNMKERSTVVTASAFTFSSLIRPAAEARLSNIKSTSPDIKAIFAGLAPA